VAPQFQLDPEVTQCIGEACASILATAIKSRRLIEDSRALLARLDVIVANDPFLRRAS
jgi:hypothetical protein